LTAIILSAVLVPTSQAFAQKVTHGGTISGGNGIYTVDVQDLSGSGVGLYTATTGPNHPAGSGLDVLFGGGQPGTSYNTIHSYTTNTDYSAYAFGSDPSSANIVNLDTFGVAPYGSAVPLPIGATGTAVTGARTTYVLPGPSDLNNPTPDALTIVQDVNVRGTTFGNSTIEVTTSITNNGANTATIGIRYLWDFRIATDDGPTFQAINPSGSVLVNETDFLGAIFESYQMADNDVSPSPFIINGTVTGPSTVVPTPTSPSLLQYVSWPNSNSQLFGYTTTPTLDIADITGEINDSAVLYFFGHDEAHAITIPAGQTKTVSASMFLTPPVAVPGLTLTPPSGTNTVGQTHTVTALATSNISPVSGATVFFTVTGANPSSTDPSPSCTTGADGTCAFTYTGTNPGTDTINAQATVLDQTVNATPVSETWISPATLTLTPPSATNVLGQTHTVTASTMLNDAPASNITVNFLVSGANTAAGSCVTGTNGTCPFTYTGIFAGTDAINAAATIAEQPVQATASKIWLPSQSTTLTYTPSGGNPETQIATVGQPIDPSAQSLALTLASVIHAINVNVEFHYEPTELAVGHAGVGIADGICEVSQGATEANDFDCRLAAGGFVYQKVGMDQVVPHIIPSHNNLGVWVRVTATRVLDGQPAVPGVDYTGPVDWYYAWNTNPPLFPSPNPEYLFGWNNLNPQMFDRHGDDPDIAFKFNITTYSKFPCTPTCVGTADPGSGGRTITLNDIVVADPPNPPTGIADVAKFVVPVPGKTPFVYEKGEPMVVAFRLRNATTGVSDPNATTFPHSVNVAVLDPVTGLRQPVRNFSGFPATFTYSKFLKLYFIVLTPKFYTVGKQYQLQVNSDLFPQALNARFVVVRDDD